MKKVYLPLLLTLLVSAGVSAQQKADSVLDQATLDNVVQYALKHYPLIQQSLLDEQIVNTTINSKLADWYPQINFVYNYQKNIQLQTLVTGLGTFRSGTTNASSPQIVATQNIFNRDVLLAAKSAGDVRLNAKETTSSRKIDVAVNVTKAYYDVLATKQQIKVGFGDIVRLKQSLKTATDQYNAGITDKTDYKRATITLANTTATLKSNQEILKYKLEYLKSLMGYPVTQDLNIVYDSLQMENEITVDTTQDVNYSNRIEYKLYQTQRNLQRANVKYQQWSYLPTVQAFGYWINYYYNNSFSELYNKRFPNTYVGVTLTLPIFQGGKRTANIKTQKYTLQRLDLDITNLKNSVNSQYAQTLASYKANLINYLTLKDNVVLAKEVYDIIQLQYKSGVKTYLEVITAETDLRTARINYFNALYLVLASKIDVQKALGQINY